MTKAPSFEAEAAKFTGFTSNNGQTVDPNDKGTMKTSTDVDLSDDERGAGVKIVGGKEARQQAAGGKQAAAPAKVELTAEEETAALAKASEGMEEGDELTDDEKADVLATALKDKKAAAKPGNSESDRVKKAQEGRRRAEARAARAESKSADLERRMAALEAGSGKATLTGDTKPAKGAADAEDKEPDPKDFEFGEVDPKFIRALARWETRQEMAKASKSQQTKQQSSAEERAEAEFTAKREAFEDAAHTAFDDFQEVVLDTVGLPKSDPAAWPLSTTLRDLILDSKQGPQIIYGLATDPKEARRIDKLTRAEQQRWFFREETKLEAQEASGEEGEAESEGAERQERQAAPRQISKAPPPPKRNSGGSGNKQPSAATTNFADFEAMATAAPRR